jgi:phage regulator Rha-like protein
MLQHITTNDGGMPSAATPSSLTMSSREIADLLEKRHDNVKRTIETLTERSVVHPQIEDEQECDALGRVRSTQVYRVCKRDSFVIVAQMSPEFTARVVDRWQELETQLASVAMPNFSDPVAAARAWADQYEARVIAERRKAEIGTRREATAMNTASQAVKKANRLELELDRSKQYASVKRMSLLYHGQEFQWRTLKHVSAEMDMPAIDVFDANYGTVKAYHADVWQEAYALGIPEGSA